MPVSILRKVRKSPFLTLIPLIRLLNVSEILKASGALKSDYKLKIQKQHSRLRFM